MSAKHAAAVPVLIWSPDRVAVYDPSTRKTTVGESIASVRHAVSGDKVVVALSRRSSFVRITHVPNASKAELAPVLALKVGQLFPIDSSEAAFDFLPTERVEAEGRVALVAAAPATTLRTITAQLSENGLQAVAVAPIGIGAQLVASGDAAFVEDAGEGLGIDVVSGGVLRVSREAPGPMTADDAKSELERSMAIAKAMNAEVFAAPGLLPNGVTPAPSSPLHALATEVLPLNLELPEIAAHREKSKAGRQKTLAVLIWAGVIAYGLNVGLDYRDSLEKANAIDARRTKALNEMKETANMGKSRLTPLEDTDAVLTQALDAKQPPGDVALVLSQLCPSGVWLTGLSLERGKLASIRGTAMDGDRVAAYLESLGRQRRFRDVKLVFANNSTIDQVSVVNFSISAHVVGNFPVMEPKKAGAKK